MNANKSLIALTAALFVLGGVREVEALDAGTDRAQSKLEEIIVTATRRETSLQDTAISITAIGSEEISRRNLSEMNDYLRTIPGVNFVDQGVGRNAVVIRGITIDPEQEANRSGPTVDIYFGEISLGGLSTNGGSADLRMIDLERVEVLRGPQGTLFGAGSLGGAVRNIPKPPNLQDLKGSIKADYSDTAGFGGDNTKFEGVLNIPLIEDVLAVRAVAYRFGTSGYIKNIAGTQLATDGPITTTYTAGDAVAAFGSAELYQNKNNIGDATYVGGRISTLWKPNDALSVTLQYITQDVEQKGIPYVQRNTGGFTQVSLQGGDNVPALDGDGDALKDDIRITNLVMEYDFGWATLLSSSAWLKDDSDLNYDASTFLGGSPVINLIPSSKDVFTEELRLVSQHDGPLQYIAGIYYTNLENDLQSIFYANGDLSLNLLGTPFGATNPLVHIDKITQEMKQLSFYGELSYDISENIELTLGARHFDYERDQNYFAEGALGGRNEDSKFDETGTNFKANLSYRPTEDALFYAQWSEGFRLGNVNFVPPASLCDVNNDGVLDGTIAPIKPGFDSDTTENFEFGTKLTLLDRRLQVNAAVYQVNWKGIPLRVFAGKLPSQAAQTCFFGTVINVAEARSQGFELETQYQINSDFTVNLGGAYTSAELSEDNTILGASSGDKLPSSPEYSVNLGVQYDFELVNYASYIRSDYAYVSDYYNLIGENGDKAGGYGQINISMGVEMKDFTINLYAHNLTNEDNFTSVGVIFPDTRAWRLRPRTIGLDVAYQF